MFSTLSALTVFKPSVLVSIISFLTLKALVVVVIFKTPINLRLKVSIARLYAKMSSLYIFNRKRSVKAWMLVVRPPRGPERLRHHAPHLRARQPKSARRLRSRALQTAQPQRTHVRAPQGPAPPSNPLRPMPPYLHERHPHRRDRHFPVMCRVPSFSICSLSDFSVFSYLAGIPGKR